MSRESVTQETKIGHNIHVEEGAKVSVGDLVITNLSSSDLVTFTKQFLKYITYRDWATAQAYLDSLKSVSSLDDECKSLLDVLQYKLEIFQGCDANIDQDLFLDLLRSPRSDKVIKDVVESIYIHHISLTSSTRAKQRFVSSSFKGTFTDQIFYELLANKEELAQRLSNEITDLYEHELCAFVLCALRCEDFTLGAELADKLATTYTSVNSEILVSLSHACLIHSKIGGRHYWLIDYELMVDLENQVNFCIDLSKKTNDDRVIKIAAILLASTSFEGTDLLNICSEKLEEAEKVIPHIRKIIKSISEDSEKLGTAKSLLNKDGLKINEQEFSLVAKDFFDGAITGRQVEKWLNRGGFASIEDEVLDQFMNIFLKSIVCKPEDKKKKIDLSRDLEQFLNFYKDKVGKYNIHAIFQLCVNLRYLELPIYIVKLLEPLLSKTPWGSPVLELYAESLSASDQRKKLDILLDSTQGDTNTFRLLAIKIERECATDNFPKALEITNIALSKYPNHCHYWWLLLHILGLSGGEIAEIKSAISRIPKNLFEEYNDEAFKLIRLVADTDLNYAESIILEWFIDNPAGMAINVTNLHFDSIISSKQTSSSNGLVSDRCSQAVVYTAGGRQYTKLLVEDCEPNQYLIDIEDPIGELLSTLDIGEEQKLGMETYKLLDKLSPIVGAFRISLNIRTELNVGNDCFHQFTFDESEGVEGLLKIFETAQEQPQLVEPEVNGRNIPLLLRLNHTHEYELVKGAFLYLYDKKSNSYSNLFFGGEEVAKESLILDILTLAYLSVTGLYLGLVSTERKLFVTRETNKIVLDWLSLMERPEHLSVTKTDEGFVKTTAEHVAKDKNINNLRALISACDVLSKSNIDMPDVLMKIRDIVDISHYSSLKASISHSIPFLCLDSVMCGLYQQPDLKLKIVNVNQLLMETKLSSMEEACSLAQCLVYLNLPVPLEYKDVIKLSYGGEKEQFIAAQVLKKYPNSFPTPKMALLVLSGCCTQSICAAYLRYRQSKNPFSWRYAEHIFYASCESAMQSLEGESCAERLALLIFDVLEAVKSLSGPDKLALELFSRFVHGHFLDAEKINLALQDIR